MAVQIKNKFKGQKLTYLFLEKETGIGRNTYDKNKIINELHFIEETFIELYNEAKSLKEELNRRER
jgi:hypothetical protein